MKNLTIINHNKTTIINSKTLQKIIKTILKQLMINDYSIEISFLTKEQISKLNKEFLNHLGPTDVITFNYSNITNQNTLTGEILVCPDIALEQSKLYSTTFENELLRYIIHGILHLLGFNDESPVEKRKMRIKENKILAASKSVWIDNNFVKNQR